MGWQIAQVNIGEPVAPLTEPQLRWFVEALAPVNAAAEAAPGFVWRLQTEAGDATTIRVFDDERLIVNLTVWASIEALADFVYRDPAHVAALSRRREAFHRLDVAYQALWWVPAGHRPTVAQAEQRLTRLRRHGPTSSAFTFREPFPAPDTDAPTVGSASGESDWFCPA